MATSLKNIPFVNPVPQMTEDGALIIEDSMQSYCAYMKYDSSMASIQLYTCSDGNMMYVPVEMARYATCGFGDPQMGTYVDACLYIDPSTCYIQFCYCGNTVPVSWASYSDCAYCANGIGVSFEAYGCWHYGALTPCIDCYGNISYFNMYDEACSQEMWINILPCGVGVWNECDGSIHMIAPCMYACEYGGWCYWDGTWYDYTCGQSIYSSVMYACYACIACSINGYDQAQSKYYEIMPCINDNMISFVGYNWEGTCYFSIGYAYYAEVLSWYDQNEQRSYTAQPITYEELTSNPGCYKIIAAPINSY